MVLHSSLYLLSATTFKMAEHRNSYDDAGDRSNSPINEEKAAAYLVRRGYGIIPPGAGPTVPDIFERGATPYPSLADYRSSSSGSSTPLSDPPDSDMDEAPSISRHGSFSSLHNAASIDRNNQPGLSRRGSELSLPDAPPLNAATDTTKPARRSSMSKPGNKGQKLRRTVSFSMTRNTAASPPPVQVNLLATAYSRCKLFVLSYVDIAIYTMDNRPAMCLPMFRLQPPPYLSATEKETYQKFLQSTSSPPLTVNGKEKHKMLTCIYHQGS